MLYLGCLIHHQMSQHSSAVRPTLWWWSAWVVEAVVVNSIVPIMIVTTRHCLCSETVSLIFDLAATHPPSLSVPNSSAVKGKPHQLTKANVHYAQELCVR